ncbi:PAS domain-containing serine/threonine-protein kinase [Choanephora cucurbitarum]|uniref:PAS domain-containing serine/threonine-protein kinase n=1 Tax=Choanephora cucurbitarum TaxID=101091 RepID=A0A1C7N3W4_9FUNG|nr:PAS domain-containing serine/threonine-protein kinase [Choanephora cucurbitarum]
MSYQHQISYINNKEPTTPPSMASTYLTHYPFHPDFLANYTMGEELGSGGYGFVVSATEKRTGIERAVKFIFRNKIPRHSWVRDHELGTIPMEIYVLKNVNHPSVIGYVDSYQDNQFFYLIMELHGTQWSQTAYFNSTSEPPRSPALSEDSFVSDDSDSVIQDYPLQRRTSCDLFECIERHNYFEEPVAKMIFHQIASCVAHLDLMGICHQWV